MHPESDTESVLDYAVGFRRVRATELLVKHIHCQVTLAQGLKNAEALENVTDKDLDTAGGFESFRKKKVIRPCFFEVIRFDCSPLFLRSNVQKLFGTPLFQKRIFSAPITSKVLGFPRKEPTKAVKNQKNILTIFQKSGNKNK